MDNDTYNGLLQRIEYLERQVTPLNPQNSKSLISEIFNLTQELNKIYKAHEELGVLMKLIDNLKIWNKLDHINEGINDKINLEDTNTSENSPDILDQIDDFDQDLKQQMIDLKYTTIQTLFNNIEKFKLLDTTKLINYIDSSQDKVHNFNMDKYIIAERKMTIRKLAENHYKVLLKNMIVFEKYLELVARENNFWQNINDEIQQITRKVNSLENDKLRQNKY